jgi:hypothetical protein
MKKNEYLILLDYLKNNKSQNHMLRKKIDSLYSKIEIKESKDLSQNINNLFDSKY